MNLYICSTYYHVLITVLKYFGSNEEIDIAITDYIPECDKLINRLNKSGLFNSVYLLESWKPLTKFDYFFYGKRNIFDIEKKYGSFFMNYKDIYIFMDDTSFARYLKDKHIMYNLIEDGFNGFKINENNKFYYMVYRKHTFRDIIRNTVFKHNINNYHYYFDCPYIKSIEINDINGSIFEGHEKGVIVCPRENLFKRIDKNNVSILLDVFLDNRNLFKMNKIAIIFTYCFFTDGYLTNEIEQIDLFKKVYSLYYDLGYNPIIKPHPRDTIDYSSSGLKCIERYFPSEILKYFGEDKIDKFVSIFSTSCNNFDKDKVDYYENIEDFNTAYLRLKKTINVFEQINE